MKVPTYGSIRKLPGWLGFVDYQILKSVVTYQNSFTSSAIVEIGVHHGKSLVPLAHFSDDRKLYAIDIFEDQSKNIDNSGSGNKRQFIKNLETFGIDKDRVVIDQRMSNEVQGDDILRAVGPVGIFHIDGGHHFDAVSADIELACSVGEDACVIVLDDTFRPEWPEVSIAAFSSRSLQQNDYHIFAIGFNKTYWCKAHWVDEYQNHLAESPSLKPFLEKRYSVHDRSILVYQAYPLPEWGAARIFLWYMSTYHPRLYPPFGRLYLSARSAIKNNRANKK